MKPQTKTQTNAATWFRTTLYSIGDAVITVDRDGKVLQVNHIAEQLTGWKESDAAGKNIENIFRILHEDTREPVENPADKIFREGRVVGLANHTLLISKDGKEIPIADSGAPIRDKEGTIIGAVLVFRDQTAEREAERKILESERKLATLIANLPGMAYRCRNDPQWTMVFVSEGFHQLTGYRSEDVIENRYLSYNDIIYPDDREQIYTKWKKILQTKEQFHHEYRIITKTGKIKWVWEQGQPIASDNDDIVAFEGFITDITDQIRTVKSLRESQKMLQTILDTIPVRVFWKDKKGIYLGCNKPFALDAGFTTPEEMIGKDDYQMGWIDQAELYRADDLKVIESNQPSIGYEEPQTTPEGKQRWLRTSKVPLQNTEGDIFGILGTYEDISDYKQAGELLRRSESLFRTVWEETLDGMRLTDENGIVIKVNDAYCRMVDMPKAAIEGNPMSVVYTNDRFEHILQRHQARFKEGTVEQHAEKELTLHNGKKVWFEISNSYFEHNEHKTLLLGVFRDVTKRVHAERALRESEAKHRTLFEETKDTIYMTSPGGRVLDINPAGVELFGYASKEEMQTIDIARDLYVNPEDRRTYIETLHRDGFVKDFEIELKRKDGNTITVLETASVEYDEKKNPVVYRGILRDITRQRILENQLRHAQKMESIGTLAGGIAHDFNNILGVILGHASLLKMHQSDPAKIMHGVETIQKATQRGASLVQQLLTFARKADVYYKSVDINEVINEIRQFLYDTLPKKIEIDITLKEDLPAIYADSTQIHQILLNLSLNARDAMPDGGTLSIVTNTIDGSALHSKFFTERSGELIHLKVSDTGTGMDKQSLERVFDPFFTTKEPGKGSGLGLAVVYSIVESYNGMIDVNSEPGRGTTFDIYLPVDQNQQHTIDSDSEVSEENLSGNEKILIIEDEDMLLESIKSILIENGYSVITARDGREGIHLYSHHSRDLFGKKIDVVISDLGLPKIAGNEVFKRIKQIDQNAHIILASGFIDPGLKRELEKEGAKYFIKKPYVPEQVLRTIRSLLDSDTK